MPTSARLSSAAADSGASTASPGTPDRYDVLVVGGGVNGAGIARDLSGRGARVLLCEQDDLASHTSSASTKLIHGGLRYLEHREFSLVRKALAEREVLLKGAPHIMWPLRFVMPHDPSMRPVWMIRAGLFLYDHLARREVLPASRTIDLQDHPAGAPLKPAFTKGFAYSDGWVEDARLVVLCALDAAERGATVLTRTACIDAKRGRDDWRITLRSDAGKTAPSASSTSSPSSASAAPTASTTTTRQVTARALVNAAGPWAAQFLAEHAHAVDRVQLRLVKGSHIVVPRLFEHDHAYIFQNPDGRIIFAIPYEGAFTLIGTTDVEHHGAIGKAEASADEIAYLCTQASRYFAARVVPGDVVWTYSGVRPLLDDESGNPAAVTRDYRLELDSGNSAEPRAPLLSVWGGKITTFRKLAEEAADRLMPLLQRPPDAKPRGLGSGSDSSSGSGLRSGWTAATPLPGGDLRAWLGADAPPANEVTATFERFVAALAARYADVEPTLLRRLARAYGTRCEAMLASGLGETVAPGVHAGELAYLGHNEWARNGDDVLWRRSKLGLHLTASQREAVGAWLDANVAEPVL